MVRVMGLGFPLMATVSMTCGFFHKRHKESQPEKTMPPQVSQQNDV